MSEFSNEEYFIWKIKKGWEKKRVPNTQEYKDRIAYEIDVITKMGFVDYMLIIADILEFAEENGVPRGAGRGCFTPNNRVRVNKHFYKNINDVSIGDKVQCEDGEWREVEKVWEYDCDEEVVDIITDKGIIEGATTDHKIWVVTAENYEKGNLKPEWINADNVKEGDFLVRN